METLWQDLRYALRQLARSPGFAGVAVLTLALGMGATTTVFSAVSALLLRPIPGAEPGRVVRLYTTSPPGGSGARYGNWSYPEFADYRDRSGVFSHLAIHQPRGFLLREGAEPENVPGAAVSGSFFEVFGLRPLLRAHPARRR